MNAPFRPTPPKHAKPRRHPAMNNRTETGPVAERGQVLYGARSRASALSGQTTSAEAHMDFATGRTRSRRRGLSISFGAHGPGRIARPMAGFVALLVALSALVMSAGAAAALAAPGISAPPNAVVGMADGHVDLPVTLSAPSTQTVTVAYSVPGGGCNYPNPSTNGTLTFTPGVTTQAVHVILNNCHIGGMSWFGLTLSAPTNATIVDPTTLVGVLGDPAPVATPGLYVRDAVVDTSAGIVNVPVLLGGAAAATSASTVTVHYTTNNGSAVAGTDYTTTSGTLTFAPGESVQNIAVPITNRSGTAPSRSFSITLNAPTNAVVVDNTGVITIGASGAVAVASPWISAPPNAVVGMRDAYVDLPVTLSAPGTKTVTVDYSVPGGGCNYPNPSTNGTLTFTPGITTQVVRVILNDCHIGGMSWFGLTLSTATNATIVDPTTLVGVLGDPAPVATPGLYLRDAVVDTSAGIVNVPVLLGGPAAATSASIVKVHYTTNDGSAIAGTDYTTSSGTLTFGPGESVQNIAVPITNRSGTAPSRSFSITLNAPTNAVVVDNTGVITIGASGAVAVASPWISAPPNAVAGMRDAYVDLPVTLSAPGTKTVTVDYSVPGGGCNYPNPSTNGTLTFTPGVTTQVVRVILNDCHIGGMSWFGLTLSTATNATNVDPTTLVGVLGDPAPVATPGLYVRDAVVDNSVGTVNVPVLLGGPAAATSASTVTVHYTTNDGSAIAGTDYTTTTGTLTFGPGESVQDIAVPITNRSGTAPSRSFSITLNAPGNAVVVDNTGVITIGASGAVAVASPGISAPPNVAIGQAQGYVDLPVTLSAPGTKTASVAYSVPGGGCNYPNPSTNGTLTFTPGVTTQVVRVILNGCNVTTNSSFTLTLSGATKGHITHAKTRVTVTAKVTAPHSPTAVTAIAGTGSATVSFKAPASDGGDPINSYTVTASPGGATASGLGSPITVGGLTAGTSYTFTVTATNSKGTGPASLPSSPVIPS